MEPIFSLPTHIMEQTIWNDMTTHSTEKWNYDFIIMFNDPYAPAGQSCFQRLSVFWRHSGNAAHVAIENLVNT